MTEKLTVKFNADLWSLGDLETFEQLTGKTLDEALRAAVVKDSSGEVMKDKRGRPERQVRLDATTLVALIYIQTRVEDPSFTLEQARALRSVDIDLVVDDTEDPTTTADAGV